MGYENAALGANGLCLDGSTFDVAENLICGGSGSGSEHWGGDWGETSMEVWYPVASTEGYGA